MIRCAIAADADAMDKFLSRYAASSMFLRGNLAAHGTQEREHRQGTTFYLSEDKNGIKAVAGITNGGYLMCQAPDAPKSFFDGVAKMLNGLTIAGMTGEPRQVSKMLIAIGCDKMAFALREQEPLYALDLAEMMPLTLQECSLVKPLPDNLPWLAEWFLGYHEDSGLPLPSGSDVDDLAVTFAANPDARLLTVNNRPVAMSNLNARTLDTVQIGGVYVPPEHRGRGYGGEIVLRHLHEVRSEGIGRAILFAASAFAARAYVAIGFSHIGAYEVALFKEPLRIKT